MMKSAFYFLLKYHMRLVRQFFFSKSEIVGLDKLPIGNPIIYSCNHQNAFLDALLMGEISPVKMSSMTRSDVFGNHAGKWFMDAVLMLPIYRMRDGFEQMAKNEEVFETVRSRLKKNQSVLIFSEGNHGNDHFLRPISKGSSRLAFESQEKMMDQDIYVVPVGLNYYHHQVPGHKLSVVYGDPIRVKDYWEEYQAHNVRGANHLKKQIDAGMKECLLIPEEDENYLVKRDLINRRNEHIPFHEFREKLKTMEGLQSRPPQRKGIRQIAEVLSLFNFGPALLLNKILAPIRDIVFQASIKWVFALFILPIWWLIIYGVCAAIWGWQVGLIAAGSCILAAFFRQKLVRLSTPSH
ncbi:MAG: 1-acyl-sn-glycerol-3-phosphate acyltransferase [Cyclobacteriaceae bacterium]